MASPLDEPEPQADASRPPSAANQAAGRAPCLNLATSRSSAVLGGMMARYDTPPAGTTQGDSDRLLLAS